MVLSSRRINNLEDIAAQCNAASGGKSTAMVLPLDVSNFDAHQEAVDKVLKAYGRIDILVLNAGITQGDSAEQTSFKVTEEVMRVNFMSLVSINRLVLPSMVQRKSGKVS